MFLDVGCGGCDLFTNIVGSRFGPGVTVVCGVVDAFLYGSPGLLCVAFDFLGGALVGELFAADSLAHALLHIADHFVELASDGAIACAHGDTPLAADFRHGERTARGRTRSRRPEPNIADCLTGHLLQGLDPSTAGDQVEDENDDSYYQQNVDKAAADVQAEPK